MSQTTLFSCRTRYDGNFIGITRSTRLPSASETSRSRHASADVRISSRGYHLNGSRTSSASCPAAASSRTSPSAWRSAPPEANGTCALQTSMRAMRGYFTPVTA